MSKNPPLNITRGRRPTVLFPREQKLVDICFQLVLTALEHHEYFKDTDQEERAAWVAGQLRQLGFDTVPRGASWGVLK